MDDVLIRRHYNFVMITLSLVLSVRRILLGRVRGIRVDSARRVQTYVITVYSGVEFVIDDSKSCYRLFILCNTIEKKACRFVKDFGGR